jgi:hypothetical protein
MLVAVVVTVGVPVVKLNEGLVVVGVVLVDPPVPLPPHPTARTSTAAPPNSANAVLACDFIASDVINVISGTHASYPRCARAKRCNSLVGVMSPAPIKVLQWLDTERNIEPRQRILVGITIRRSITRSVPPAYRITPAQHIDRWL